MYRSFKLSETIRDKTTQKDTGLKLSLVYKLMQTTTGDLIDLKVSPTHTRARTTFYSKMNFL